MTAVSATGPSVGTSLAQLIADDSGESATSPATPTATDTNSAGSSTATSSGGSGPATYFTLSDQAKANLAASNRLDAYAEAHRDSDALAAGETTPADSLKSILATITQPAGTQPTTVSAEIAVAGLQIPTVTDTNAQQPFQPFTPTKDLSKSVTVDGYTLTLNTDASTQWYGIELNGNGIQAYSKHFGSSDGAVGVSGVLPGIEVSAGPPDQNNEAFDAITVTRNTATASSASISSSAGSASTSSANAQSSSITFLVNYATGAISVEQSIASVSTQSSQSSSPGSALSTLA
ncbi:MAG TPA: hypothetical protein VMA30_04425 [Xanthobacteraceae bacterium]|nr:hypothetical protein [Xanthobacteraceae bacterium]